MALLFTGSLVRGDGGAERAHFIAAQALTPDGHLAAGAMVRALGAREPMQSNGGWTSAPLHSSLTPADVERRFATTSAVRVERLDEVPAQEAERFLGTPAVNAVFGVGASSEAPEAGTGVETVVSTGETL